MKKDDTFEEIKRACGGGEEADIKKHPITEKEMSDCVDRLGCVSIQAIIYERRKIRIGGK